MPLIQNIYRRQSCYIQKLGSGGLDILTSCNVISEGTDIPIIRHFDEANRKPVSLLAASGRVLRTAPGKKHAIIIDALATLNHTVNDGRDWSLKHRQKKALHSSKSALIALPSLPNLEQVCPICGHEFIGQGGESGEAYLWR